MAYYSMFQIPNDTQPSCARKLTQKNNVQRQSSAQQHHHWLCMPETIHVWIDVADTFDHKAMNNCGKPQVDVAAATAQGYKTTIKHQNNDMHTFKY